MDSLLSSLNVELNFWDANPNFRTVKEFNKFYTTDRSFAKHHSSKVMWAIAFLVDLHPHNIWRNKEEEDKKPILAEDVIKDKDFNWFNVQHLIDTYRDLAMSPTKKALANFLNKLKQRQEFIDKTPFTLDQYTSQGKVIKGTASQLDTMMLNTSKLFEQYDELVAKYEAEEEEGKVRGGRTESLSEQGAI